MVDSITRFGLTVTWDRLLAGYAVAATFAGGAAIMHGPDWLGMFFAFICGISLAMVTFCHAMVVQRLRFTAMNRLMNDLMEQNEALGHALAEIRSAPPIAPDKPTTH